MKAVHPRRLTWSNEEPTGEGQEAMVVDDEAAPYNGSLAARRGEDSTNGGRHDGDEDATASRASPQGNVPAVEFDRSEGEMIVVTWIVYHMPTVIKSDAF